MFLMLDAKHMLHLLDAILLTPRTILPKVKPKMFEHWVYTFGREIIIQSSKHPLVSGFYKLLATCLKICKRIGYFSGVSVGDVVDKDSVAMETDVTDKQACFILFRKYMKEVCN